MCYLTHMTPQKNRSEFKKWSKTLKRIELYLVSWNKNSCRMVMR